MELSVIPITWNKHIWSARTALCASLPTIMAVWTMLFVFPFSQTNPLSDAVTGRFISAVLPSGSALELLNIYHIISYVKEHTLLNYLTGLSCVSQDSRVIVCLHFWTICLCSIVLMSLSVSLPRVNKQKERFRNKSGDLQSCLGLSTCFFPCF